MRKLVIALAFLLSTAVYAQEEPAIRPATDLNTFSIGARVLHLYDLPSYRYDDPFSQDMKGLNGDYTNFDLGFDIYLEKQFTPLLGLQLGFRYANISGANEVEYYQNSFKEVYGDLLFIMSNLDLRKTQSPWNFYGKIGVGTGTFEAKQFLISDDSPDSELLDNFWEGHIGPGLNYELNNFLRVELEVMYNVAFSDGFDGFNNATGSDPYLTTALGIAYTLGNREKKPMYAVNYFGDEYLDITNKSRQPPPPEPTEPEVTKEDLASMQEGFNEKIKRLEATDQQIKKHLEWMKESDSLSRSSFVVYFDFDSSTLSRETKKQLASALADQDRNKLFLELTAYADKSGKPEYNEKLKQKRAESVRDFLVSSLGFNADNIIIVMGEAAELSTEDQFLNRMVSIKY